MRSCIAFLLFAVCTAQVPSQLHLSISLDSDEIVGIVVSERNGLQRVKHFTRLVYWSHFGGACWKIRRGNSNSCDTCEEALRNLHVHGEFHDLNFLNMATIFSLANQRWYLHWKPCRKLQRVHTRDLTDLIRKVQGRVAPFLGDRALVVAVGEA